MRRLPRFLIGFLLVLGATQALAQPTAYTEVFYPSGTFRIQAYLYRPSGDGPFPLIIYNHGSRAGHEHESRPFSYIGNLMLQNRYAVLVPERLAAPATVATPNEPVRITAPTLPFISSAPPSAWPSKVSQSKAPHRALPDTTGVAS